MVILVYFHTTGSAELHWWRDQLLKWKGHRITLNLSVHPDAVHLAYSPSQRMKTYLEWRIAPTLFSTG